MSESGSCEALQIEKPQQLKDEIEEEEEEISKLEAKEAGGEEKMESEVREVGGVELLSKAEAKTPQSETLAMVEVPDNNRFDGMRKNSTAEMGEGSQLKALAVVSPQEVKPISTIWCEEVKTQNHHSSPVYARTLPEGYPSGQKINGTPLQSYPPPLRRMKTPITDGYNWRKYGQKQVKSPIGSRSYYKCTYSECHAKKVECSDDTGHIIEIVNKGKHSHDPPRKNSITRESRVVSSAGPVQGNGVTEESIKMPDDSEPSTSPKGSNLSTKAMKLVPERKRQYSDCSDKNGETEVGEEHSREPEPKERTKKDEIASPDSDEQPGKKHKIVVHAAGDVGISGDGYRWRKYGQKMVKGNPHPRNYYRCTSAGCPVRKHIETAADNPSAVTITYKGAHDHDMPVPKKRHGPPSAPLVAATAPAAMNMQPHKPDTTPNQITSTKWSVGTEGELTGEAMDLGGQKAIESAKTLLSIGFEIKPC